MGLEIKRLNIEEKVTNKGQTHAGRLYSGEVNDIVDAINRQAAALEQTYNLINGLQNFQFEGLRFRMAWSLDTASSETLYYVSNETSRDAVSYLGCLWACLKEKTLDEPTWYSKDWLCIAGSSRLSVEIESSRGSQFRLKNLDTILTAKIYFGDYDVTEKVKKQNDMVAVWARDSGVPSMDAVWKGAKEDEYGLSIHVTKDDMNMTHNPNRFACFEITVHIPTSDGYSSVTRNLTFKY